MLDVTEGQCGWVPVYGGDLA